MRKGIRKEGSPFASAAMGAADSLTGWGIEMGCEGIMQGTPMQPDEVRSEQLRATGSPMHGVLGPLQSLHMASLLVLYKARPAGRKLHLALASQVRKFGLLRRNVQTQRRAGGVVPKEEELAMCCACKDLMQLESLRHALQ